MRNDGLNYKKIYRGMAFLARCQRMLIIPAIDILKDLKRKHPGLLLICYSDSVDLFLQQMPPEEAHQWLILSLYARAEALPKALIKKHPSKANMPLLDYAAEAGNSAIVEYLLDPKHGFHLHPTHETLDNAARSGKVELFQYLFKYKRLKTRIPNPSSLFISTPEDNNEYTPTPMTLNIAAYSGNLRLLQLLLNPKNGFYLSPTKRTLDNAAASGKFLNVRYLLEKHQDIRPDAKTLNSAIYATNVETVLYLLDPNNGFDLKSNKDTLRKSIQSKNKSIENIIRSSLQFKKILYRISQSHLKEEELTSISHYSPQYFSCVMAHITSHPEHYRLSEKISNALLQLTVVKKAVAQYQQLKIEEPSIKQPSLKPPSMMGS